MSSISFPSEDVDHMPSSSLRDSMQAPFYAPPAFDVGNSFQMNPLSAHPPRTPRPSTVTQPHFSNTITSVYDELSEERTVEKDVAADTADQDEEVDEESERVVKAEKKVGRHEVWRDMLTTSYGRDKTFKLIQYSIRVYLVLHMKLLFRSNRGTWQQGLTRRLESARSGLSFTRKMLILFNWLTPLSAVMAQKAVPYSSSGSSLTPHNFGDLPATKTSSFMTSNLLSHPFLRALLSAPPPVLLDLVNGLSDDICTLSRLGLIGPKVGVRAARFSDWCWFFGTLVNIVENGVEMSIVEGLQREVENRAYQESLDGTTSKSRPKAAKLDEKELARLRRKTYWLHVSRTKLIMDFIFVSYEIFRIKRGKNAVQSFVGLAAAILSFTKLYDKTKTILANKVLSNAD